MTRRYNSLCLATIAIALVLLLGACGDRKEPRGDDAGPGSKALSERVDREEASVALASHPAARDEIAEPVYRELVIAIRDVVQLPAYDNRKAGARINALASAGDGSGRLFVVDMDGRIYLVERETLAPEPFLDVSVARGKAFVHDDQEKGLTSVAFHPDYADRSARGFGKIYTATTESADSGRPDFPTVTTGKRVSHHDVIAEWRVDPANRNRIDPRSRREVLRIPHPFRDHTIGQIGFNPTADRGDPDYGMLYIGVGDGGNTVAKLGEVSAFRTAQNPRLPLGKILRIDPLQSNGRNYSIPPDNPFLNKHPFLPEIWAYGLRNPQRFCWDMAGDNKMILIDIGQSIAEEINVGLAGSNYGWSEREGNFAVNHGDERAPADLPANDAGKNYTYPAVQYEHDLGRAITGGYVYRGRLIPELRGMYVFGDIASGRIFFTDAASLANGKLAGFGEIKLKYSARQRTLLEIQGNSTHAGLRFGMDAVGELYLLTKRDGMVRKFSMVSQ